MTCIFSIRYRNFYKSKFMKNYNYLPIINFKSLLWTSFKSCIIIVLITLSFFFIVSDNGRCVNVKRIIFWELVLCRYLTWCIQFDCFFSERQEQKIYSIIIMIFSSNICTFMFWMWCKCQIFSYMILVCFKVYSCWINWWT